MECDLGKLFIGGISWDTDEDRLKEYFSTYGEVVETVIMRDRATGRARGFGFVVFSDPAVAERVILDKHVIDGRTVEAKKAVPKDDHNILKRNIGCIHGSPGPGRTKKIFVGGLASTVTQSEFKKYFDQFGTINDVVVMYDHNTQRPRGFGFITYDSEEAVDRVLYKTFHELNGKMVEIKRAVPKELSPGPIRSPLIGYNYGLSRNNSFLNSYPPQGYNMDSVGGFGVRMESRFSPVSSGGSGFSPFSSSCYGVGINMEPNLSPGFGRSSNRANNLGYGQMPSPYLIGNSNRYTVPVGYSGTNVRNDSHLSSTTRNVWGSGGINNVTSAGNLGTFSSSRNGSFGLSYGSGGLNWGPSPVPGQGVGGNTGYTSGSIGYGTGDGRHELGKIKYGGNSGPGADQASSIAASSSGYEGPYGDVSRSGSGYDDTTWLSRSTPDINGSGSFGYGIGNIGPDVAAKSSESYVGTYSVSSRQPNRGIAA